MNLHKLDCRCGKCKPMVIRERGRAYRVRVQVNKDGTVTHRYARSSCGGERATKEQP